MGRIRYIKPDFFKHPGLGELSVAARLFFAGLWCQADREGRLKDRPKALKLEIMPWDSDVDADQLLNDLARGGFVIRYLVASERYVQILNFGKHQRPHPKEMKSQIPAPDNGNCESRPAVEHHSQDVANPPVVSFPSGSMGNGEPPVAPRKSPGGVSLTLPRLKKRNRGAQTLAEQQLEERDRLRDQRSKQLFDAMQFAESPWPRDEQLAWVQERCHASPEEAADAVALVEHAHGVRNGSGNGVRNGSA